jgi:hypothetical protein
MTQQPDSASEEAHKNTGAKPKKMIFTYRKLRRKLAQSRARMPLIWLRHRNLFPNDVFLGSYPKAGNTWIRFVLYEMLSGKSAGFRAVHQFMPGVENHSKALRLLPQGARMIGTHEFYRKDYRRAIYLVRDARQTLLAEFAFLKVLGFIDDDLDKFISTFLSGDGLVYGYAPWQRHISSWLDSPIAGTENLLLVRFEDVRQNPVEWFTRMAEFLQVDIDHERIERAIANNTLDSMRAKERKEPVGMPAKGRFVRNGAISDWASQLSLTQVHLIEQHTGQTLLRLGYPLSSRLNGGVATDPMAIRQAS